MKSRKDLDPATRSAGDLAGLETALQAARNDPHRSFISTVSVVPESRHEGPLSGIPFAAKDNLDTVELPTTANTPALLTSRPDAENPVIDRLKRAGATLIGKTNMHELGLGVTTDDAAFPATRNPGVPDFSAGGSSGGSGAAVAAGIVPFALGTDTGGSVTIPASWCGVFGFRPSTGRWPGGGVVPLAPTRDTVGVIAESLELISQVDEIVCRASVDEVPASAPGVVVRIGVPLESNTYLSGLSNDVFQVWSQSLSRLAEAKGIELVAVDTEDLHRLESRCGMEIEFFEISFALEQYLNALPTPMSYQDLRTQAARTEVKEVLAESWDARGREERYRAALDVRKELQASYRSLFSWHGLNAIMYPSVPFTATRLGETTTRIDGAAETDIFLAGIRNVNPGSVSGQPTVCLPAGRSDAGMPVGISVEGIRMGDRALLKTAGAVLAQLGDDDSRTLGKRADATQGQ